MTSCFLDGISASRFSDANVQPHAIGGRQSIMLKSIKQNAFLILNNSLNQQYSVHKTFGLWMCYYRISGKKFRKYHAPLIVPRAQDGDCRGDDFSSNVNEDWMSFRAKLVSLEAKEKGQTAWSVRRSEANMRLLEQQNPWLAAEDDIWAHAATVPEQGSLLIASNAAIEERLLPEDLWQAVILLTRIDASADCIEGLVLNRPTTLTMKRLPLIDAATGKHSRLCSAFSEERVYFGGKHNQELVMMMHGYSHLRDVHGTYEIRPGVYLGYLPESFDAACDTVDEGRKPASDYKFFCGRVSWTLDQLKGEIESGAWHCASCSRTVALKQCLSLPVPLWCEILRLMGGEYADEASRVYPDI